MISRPPALLIAVALTALALPAHSGRQAAVPPPPAARISLTTEPRLSGGLGLQEPYTTLSDAVARVGARTGVDLRVKRDVRDENVVLVVRSRPAGEVLDQIAETFGYVWTKRAGERGDYYELGLDEEGRRREARLREAFYDAVITALDRELEAVRPYFDLPEGERDRRMEHYRREQSDGDLPPEQRGRAAGELRRLGAAGEQKARAMIALYRGLLPSQRQALVRSGDLRFSAAGAKGMERLPQPITAALTSDWGDAGAWYGAHPPRDIRVELRVEWRGTEAILLSRFELVGEAPPGYAPPGHRWSPLLSLHLNGTIDLSPTDREQGVVRQETADPRLQQHVVTPVPGAVVVTNPATYVPHVTLPFLVEEIARQAPGLSFISDGTLKPLEMPSAGGTALDVLNQAAAKAHSRWRFDARGYVLLRNALAPVDRPRAIPASTLRRAMDQALDHDGPTLMETARLAAQLTDDQIRGLSETPSPSWLPLEFRWPAVQSFALQAARDDLRFLASLTPQQVRTLEGGGPFAYAQLSAAQRQAFARALENLSARPDQSMEPIGNPAPGLLAHSSVSMTRPRGPDPQPPGPPMPVSVQGDHRAGPS